MKLKVLLTTIALFLMCLGHAQAKENIKVYLTYNTYSTPSNESYFELHLSIDANSMEYAKIEGNKKQAKAQITMLFSINDSIHAFKKYIVESPVLDDSASTAFTLLSQERFQLPKGKYLFTLKVKDLNSDDPEASGSEEWTMPDYSVFSISDILLVESYKIAEEDSKTAKSNLEIYPHQDYFFPEKDKILSFYYEIYNSNKALSDTGDLLVKSGIADFSTGEMLNSYVQIKRAKAKSVIPIFTQMDISQLPSGNYYVCSELYDRNNQKLLSKKIHIQRLNNNVDFNDLLLASTMVESNGFFKINNRDSLQYYVKSLYPIATPQERPFITNKLKERSVSDMQKFLSFFWTQRNSENPFSTWQSYNKVVKAVEEEFGTQTVRGFDTDRGNIFLKYGAPDQRVRMTDNPVSLPYEIWHYYKYQNQTNLKFVFIARSLSHDFVLEHSTADGEVKNPDWQNYLDRTQQATRSDNPARLHRADDSYNFGESSGEIYNLNK